MSTQGHEDSPAPQRPSNRLGLCGAAPELLPSFRELLRLALQTSGAERAYVVSSSETGSKPDTHIEAIFSARADGDNRTSSTILRRALLRNESFICANADTDRRLVRGDSVRALSLRSIVSAPINLAEGYSGALVLDSRMASTLPTHTLQKLTEACAFLLGSMVAKSSGSPLPAATPNGSGELVGNSEPFRRMLRKADCIAPTELPVLIEGESGSGKEGVARRLHTKSRRRLEPFIAVNCAAFTDSLLDAELFGAVRGAYTGADRDRTGLIRLAQHGTLFLDEVGEMSPQMQAKLLRVLEERVVRPVGGSFQLPVDVRVLAATHHDLRRWMEQQLFREDLYYRLAVLDIRVPPLRERLNDLPLLVEALTPRLVRETGLNPPQLTNGAWNRLNAYSWPGNIRELHSVLARAMLHAAGASITSHRLSLTVVSSKTPNSVTRTEDRLEYRMIYEALRAARGNLTEAAEQIGWTRQKLYRRMHALSIRC